MRKQKTPTDSLALDVRGISKQYRLGKLAPYAGLKKNLKAFIKRLLGMKPAQVEIDEQIWALRDINFKVGKGEVVGIIGRNGAGKSTLLKILSRITAPTSGTIDVYGRIGSLLEVGTGFHPDLTGRENIFLNGSIIGMSKAEITKNFDAIVAFAELEQFIDTPVKHYSSGMYMRLAFAVSSHLSHEILVLDEVLAVGDSAFQQKCLAKMENEANSGRTVLFVSHDMGSIVAFCDRCILIEKGNITMDGDPAQVVAQYQERSALKFSKKDAFATEGVSSGTQPDNDDEPFRIIADVDGIPPSIRDVLSRGERFGEGQAKFTSCKISYFDPSGRPSSVMKTGYDLEVELSLKCLKVLEDVSVAGQICDRTGYMITDFSTAMTRTFIEAVPGENFVVTFRARNLRLRPDKYRLTIWIGRYGAFDADVIPMAAKISVEMNPDVMKYPEANFLGVYVCEYATGVKKIPVADALSGVSK